MKDRVQLQRKQSNTSIISNPLLAKTAERSSLPSPTVASRHELSRISLRPQAKLKIGQPGDAYEQEADRVASQVMSMPDRNQQQANRESTDDRLQRKSVGDLITPLLQREEMPEEEELQMKAADNFSIQREELPEEEEELQMKSENNFGIQREEVPEEEEELQAKLAVQRVGNNLTASSDISDKLHSRWGGGTPLDDGVRNFMEPRFGADFSQVKVHSDSEAVQMARDVGAQAFTYGSDVYFGAGKSPGNNELTAHELTHVVQQSNIYTNSLQPQSKIQRFGSEEQMGDSSLQQETISSIANSVHRSANQPMQRVCNECQDKPKEESLPAEESDRIQAKEEAGQTSELTSVRPQLDQADDPQSVGTDAGTTRSPQVPEKRYDFSVNVHTKPMKFHSLTPLQVIEKLRALWRLCHDDLDEGREWNESLVKRRKGQWIVGFWADTVGGADLPDPDMWNEVGRGILWDAKQALDATDATLKAHWQANEASLDRNLAPGLENNPYMQAALAFDPTEQRIHEAVALLEKAATELGERQRIIDKYVKDSNRGAERAITGLELVKTASAATVTIGTGGFTGVMVGGAYAGTQSVAQQASEIHYGLRDKIDWAGIAFDTVVGALSGYMGDKLGNFILRRLMRNPATASLGRKLLSNAVSDYISGRAGSTIHLTARSTFDLVRGHDITWEQYLDRLADQIADPLQGAMDVIVGYASRRATAARTPKKPPSVTPADAPAGGKTETEITAGGTAKDNGAAPASGQTESGVKGDVPEVKGDAPETSGKNPSEPASETKVSEGGETQKPSSDTVEIEKPSLDKDFGTEGGKKVLAEEPTADGHKIKITEDGVLLCSTCSPLRRQYAKEIELAKSNPEIAKIVDDLNAADAIKDPALQAKAEAEIKQRLSQVRNQKILELQKGLGLSDEATRILQEQQVETSLIEKLVNKGIKPDDIALFSEVRHGLDILESLTDRKIEPHVAQQVLSLAEKNGLLDRVNALVGKGNLLNPAKLRAILESINIGDKGALNELNIASDIASKGHDLEIGTQGDVVDFGKTGDPTSDKEVLQIKEVRSGKEVKPGEIDAFTKNLQEAELQLGGKSKSGKPKTTEIPQPGFIRVADISIINPDNPLFNGDRATLIQAIEDGLRHSTAPDGSPIVNRVRIRNSRGIETFEASDFRP